MLGKSLPLKRKDVQLQGEITMLHFLVTTEVIYHMEWSFFFFKDTLEAAFQPVRNETMQLSFMA